jgi:hypothetical protein
MGRRYGKNIVFELCQFDLMSNFNMRHDVYICVVIFSNCILA